MSKRKKIGDKERHPAQLKFDAYKLVLTSVVLVIAGTLLGPGGIAVIILGLVLGALATTDLMYGKK